MSDRIAAQNKMSKKCPSDFDPQIKCQKNVRRAPASSKKVRKRSGGLRCPPKRSGKGQSSPHPGNDWSLLRSTVRVSPHTRSTLPGRLQQTQEFHHALHMHWRIWSFIIYSAFDRADSQRRRGAGVRDRAAKSCGAAGPPRLKVYIIYYIYVYTHIHEGSVRPQRGSKVCKAVCEMDLISRTVVGRHFFKVTCRNRHLFDYFRSFSDGLL